MKNLAERVWLLMTDYATTSCTNMDKVWDIIKRNVEERVGPISPVQPMGTLDDTRTAPATASELASPTPHGGHPSRESATSSISEEVTRDVLVPLEYLLHTLQIHPRRDPTDEKILMLLNSRGFNNT